MTRAPQFGLLQERYRRPYEMLVVCALLNRTRGSQVRPIARELFRLCPSPAALGSTNAGLLETLLAPLGFGSIRAQRLRAMGRQMAASGSWLAHPGLLPGVGAYALDSWRMFVLGEPHAAGVTDRRLIAYQRWLRRLRERDRDAYVRYAARFPRLRRKLTKRTCGR